LKFETERKAQKAAASTAGTAVTANAADKTAPADKTAAATKSPASATPPLASENSSKAQEYLSKAVTMAPRYDYGYFQLGVLYSYLNQAGKALDAFVKAVATEGGFAAPARQNLEYLYKLTHKNSLDGLEPLIAKARAELPPKPEPAPQSAETQPAAPEPPNK
jgi:tetratricopeptide (TPR) repeat protein